VVCGAAGAQAEQVKKAEAQAQERTVAGQCHHAGVEVSSMMPHRPPLLLPHHAAVAADQASSTQFARLTGCSSSRR